jgi:uncharacterized protein (TIGR02300 family)
VDIPAPRRPPGDFAGGSAVGRIRSDDVVKPEWGIKRLCQSCGARYYDFLRTPIVCPSCGTTFDSEAVLKSRRARPLPVDDPKPKARKETAEVEDAEDVDDEEEEELDEEEDTLDEDDIGDDEDEADEPVKRLPDVDVDDDDDDVDLADDDEDDLAPIEDEEIEAEEEDR